MTEFETLISSRSWSAYPWDYPSAIYLQFRSDSSAELTFGYGQTIYAVIKCRFALSEPNKLTLFYLDSPAYQRFKGFKPSPGCESRTLRYSLAQHTVAFEVPYEGPVMFHWRLTVDRSPFPDGRMLPDIPVPRDYYGYREELESDSETVVSNDVIGEAKY